LIPPEKGVLLSALQRLQEQRPALNNYYTHLATDIQRGKSAKVEDNAPAVDSSERVAWIDVRLDGTPRPAVNYRNYMSWLVRRMNEIPDWWNWWGSGRGGAMLDIEIEWPRSKEEVSVSHRHGITWASLHVQNPPLESELATSRATARSHLETVLGELGKRLNIGPSLVLPRSKKELAK
jgi:hypothetical protein